MTEYIERDVALEIVKRTSGDYAAAFAEIAHRPAADVAPVRWNSMDENPPGDDLVGKPIIVSIRRRYGSPYTIPMRWWGDRHQSIWQDVTHWMPLPEPPGED